MATLNHSLQFLFFANTLFLFITQTHLHAGITTNDLVTTTCSPTPDPKICESALRSDPRSSTAANTESLILIMVDVVRSRFSDSIRIAKDLTRKAHDPATIRALKNCIEIYQVVLDYNVGTATRAVKQGDPKFGEQAMLDSGKEVEACKSGFPGGKVPRELAGRTQILHRVSYVAASLIKTME